MTKSDAYKAGYYKFDVPPVSTGNWTDDDWMRYIDGHGIWTVEIDKDETELARRELSREINAEPGSREALEAEYGQVWDTAQLQEDFTVLGFMTPVVVVKRKSDDKKGSLEFQARPRFYFNFQEAS